MFFDDGGVLDGRLALLRRGNVSGNVVLHRATE